MEGVNFVAILLGLLATVGSGATSVVALGLLIARRATAALRLFAAGLLAAAVVFAIATLSFLEDGQGFHDEGTEPLIIAMALSLLLAGIGQFIAALRSPRTYAVSLGWAAASIVIPLVAAGLADGSIRNVVAMGWVLTTFSLLLAGVSLAVAVRFPSAPQPGKSAQPDDRAILFLCVLGLALSGTQTAWAQPARLIHTFAKAEDNGVRFSKDGRILLLYSGIEGVRLYDPAGWKELRTLRTDAKVIINAEYHPDGKTLATGNSFNRVHLWDVATGKSVAVWEASPKNKPGTAVRTLNYSPDGKALVVNGSYVCEPGTGKVICMLSGAGATVELPRYSPDGKYLAGIVSGTGAEIWDVETGKSVGKVRHDGGPQLQGLAFSPDGKTLATGGIDLAVRLWDFPGLKPAGALEPIGVRTGNVKGAGPLVFSPDGKSLAVGDGEGFIYRLFVKSCG